jgi:signal transduction histidine kinase
MKKSIILKAMCFILIPISILSIILAAYSIYVQNASNYNERKCYFSSNFVYTYMNDISTACENLIYNNSNYYNLDDGDKIIYYPNNDQYNSNVKELKYLIIYKNKALTNIELNDSTRTIEGIKNFINESKDVKKTILLNGEISSDNHMIKKYGVQYLDNLTNKYYTKSNNTDIEYITTKYNDFEVYSFYKEGFRENSKESIMLGILSSTPIITDNSYIVIPLCSILIMLMVIYLVISIGSDERLNKFDKIPFEIIAFLSILISSIPLIAFEELSWQLEYNFNAILSLVITVGLTLYIIAAICITTFIRRIKAKSFWRTTIIGKIYYWLKEEVMRTLTYSASITSKVFIYGIGMSCIAFFILVIFRDSIITVFLELLLFGKILYNIIKFLKDYSKIETRLKEMREGNNQTALDVDDFVPQLKYTAECINNISEGVETAIQDRMKSERLKAELITNVSHDIKTPLTSIINYVDLLKNENIDNEKAKEYIGILDNKANRLKKLTEDLVEASKVSTGNISLNMEKINIVELIKQAIGEFEDKFQKKGLDVIINCLKNEIYIMADSRYMYRIIENLFSNISKYALENSRVYIDLYTIEQEARIEIKNISKEKLNISSEELMQRFVRGDTSRTTEGSGLGISIAQNLTELQHGKFDLILDGDLFKVEMDFELI